MPSKEKTLEYSRRYRIAHPERIREQAAAYRAANRQKTRENSLKWYYANREKSLEYGRNYCRAHPEKRLNRHRKWRGLPNPTRPCPLVCECCGMSPGKQALHLDHCHSTGKFRGWLCSNCNLGIGRLGDSIEGLELAIAYLRKVTSKDELN